MALLFTGAVGNCQLAARGKYLTPLIAPAFKRRTNKELRPTYEEARLLKPPLYTPQSTFRPGVTPFSGASRIALGAKLGAFLWRMLITHTLIDSYR